MSQTVIDDQDTSRVKYTGTWIRGGGAQEHDGTVASSTNVGDNFTVTFSGNSIVVYGTIDATSGGVLTNYSIDGAPAVQVSSQAGKGDTVKQQFWASPQLTLGKHELLVTMAKIIPNQGPDEGTIWFDYFVATDLTIASDSGSKKIDKKVLVGGVVGGLAILSVIVLLLFYYLKVRQRRRAKTRAYPVSWPDKQGHEASAAPLTVHPLLSRYTVEPFILDLPAVAAPSTSPLSTENNPTELLFPQKSALYDQSIGQSSIHTGRSLRSPPSSSGLSAMSFAPPEALHRQVGKHQVLHDEDRPRPPALDVQPPAPSTGSPSIRRSSAQVQHVDSGVRALDAERIETLIAPVELPPVYSPH